MNKREKLFAETHPSLCGKHMITCIDGTWFYANNYSEPKQKVHCGYSDYAIQKHTTDNQRIRDFLSSCVADESGMIVVDYNDAIKELGLGDMND